MSLLYFELWHGRLALKTRKMRVPQLLFGRFQQSANLLAKFWIVRMAVFGNGVIYRHLEYFCFAAFDPQRAATLAGIVAAID